MKMHAYLSIIALSTIAISTLIIGTGGYAQAQTPQSDVQINEQTAETRWVSDDLFTYLRAGPSKNYRLVGTITAGSQLQLLQTDAEAGYAQVIDDRQRTGWIELEYVSKEPTIRESALALETLLKQQNDNATRLQTELNATSQKLKAVDAQKTKFNRQVTTQLEEIARLNELIKQRERANSMQWFTRGAVLGVISLLIGYILGVFGRKRKSSGRLM